MSKPAARATGKRLAEDGDICPVCKSSRYLNPNMRFLVNPECYHKMCESCVDRIFSHGPAPCPIAGCKKTLRKAKFRSQTFEDLKVEREVDIRRRVARAMDKQEADFETLKDFNDYLEEVETITWNLILKVDVEQTERRLRLFEEAQKAELNPNAPRRAAEPDTSTLSETSHVVLKKGGTQRKVQAAASLTLGTPDDTDTGFNFRGLKKRELPKPEKMFDAFGGWNVETFYSNPKEEYDNHFFSVKPFFPKSDVNLFASGYDANEYYVRALRDAFGGLGVFIEDEMLERENESTHRPVTVAAGGGDVEMSDVF